MVSKIWLSDNLRVSKTYFLEARGVLEHPEHPSGNATAHCACVPRVNKPLHGVFKGPISIKELINRLSVV